MELVSGLHHVSMKCRPGEEYGRVRAFYSDVLGMAVSREWADGILFDTGDGSLVEIFTADDDLLPKGTIRHFALATMDGRCMCRRSVGRRLRGLFWAARHRHSLRPGLARTHRLLSRSPRRGDRALSGALGPRGICLLVSRWLVLPWLAAYEADKGDP